MNRSLFLILAATAVVATGGCSNSKHHTAAEGVVTHVEVPDRLAHEFYASWGHDGRGGAALRKPTYQHVMGSEGEIMTTQGKLVEWPQAKTPDGVVVTALNHGMNAAIFTALDSAPDTSALNASRKAALRATDDEYQRAYRKFCHGGGMAMTEREWELVALGGPNGVPTNLRDKCLRNK